MEIKRGELPAVLGRISPLEQRIVYDRYAPLIRRLSRRALRAVSKDYAEDVLSAGWLGLVDALSRRTPTMTENEFEAFASYRIRGAMFDYLRRIDPLPRQVRRTARRVAEATSTVTRREGRTPQPEEVAEAMGITFEEYQQVRADVAQQELAYYDEVERPAARTSLSPEARAVRSNLAVAIEAAVEALPERLHTLVQLYYQDGLTLQQIGRQLGVTESRASQLHSQAMKRIRAEVDRASNPPPPDEAQN